MDVVLLIAAGLAAGAMNGAVGAGTIITYPVLVSIGVSPVVANGTNCVGLTTSGVAATWGYRAELRGKLKTLLPWVLITAIGSAIGSLLVVQLPEKVFEVLVPWLIATACLLVVLQPLVRKLNRGENRPLASLISNGLVGIYGGYFGAGQGVAYLGVLSAFATKSLQQANAYKNVLATVANGVAALVFIGFGAVDFGYALLIAIGALVGGYLGAFGARHASDWQLRGLVVLISIVSIIVVVTR